MDTEMLNEHEVEQLFLTLARTRGSTDKVTEEDMEILVQWAVKARFYESILSVILKGFMAVDVQNGEVVFTPNEKGEWAMQKMLHKEAEKGMEQIEEFLAEKE